MYFLDSKSENMMKVVFVFLKGLDRFRDRSNDVHSGGLLRLSLSGSRMTAWEVTALNAVYAYQHSPARTVKAPLRTSWNFMNTEARVEAV